MMVRSVKNFFIIFFFLKIEKTDPLGFGILMKKVGG